MSVDAASSLADSVSVSIGDSSRSSSSSSSNARKSSMSSQNPNYYPAHHVEGPRPEFRHLVSLPTAGPGLSADDQHHVQHHAHYDSTFRVPEETESHATTQTTTRTQPTVILYAPSPPASNEPTETVSASEAYGPDRLQAELESFPVPPAPSAPSGPSPGVAYQPFQQSSGGYYAPYSGGATTPLLFPPQQPVPFSAMPPAALPFLDPRYQPPYVQQPEWETRFNTHMLTSLREPLAREACIVTPGVSNTPNIMHALDAITKTREGEDGYPESRESPESLSMSPAAGFPAGASQQSQEADGSSYKTRFARSFSSQGGKLRSSASYVMNLFNGTPEPREFSRQKKRTKMGPGGRPIKKYKTLTAFKMPGYDSDDSIVTPVSLVFGPEPLPPAQDQWKPVDKPARGFPPLNFRPGALRPAALATLVALNVLMLVAIIFCAAFSHARNGLVAWGSNHDGLYFVFRILFQLLAAVILLFAQYVATTSLRILPFVRLASADLAEREGSVFQDMYPSTFLWPRWVRDGRLSWDTWVALVITWLFPMVLPLQSSLFTVILVDGAWRWAAVQGVAWTLVVLYLALLTSTALTWRHWSAVHTTGLMWDPRSIADTAVMVSDTNTWEEYSGTEMAATRDGLKFALRRRVDDRLGYWAWKDNRPGFWYALGNTKDNAHFIPVPSAIPGTDMARVLQAQRNTMLAINRPDDHGNSSNQDIEALASSPQVRYRYLPWWLRTSALLLFAMAGSVLLVALLLVSLIIPSTRITTAGFPPGLSAAPRDGAFSAADFLYSFLPSFLGLFLFLLFQTVDLHLRVLQPWAALSTHASPRGASARHSLLADYAACFPLQSGLHAARNGHWRCAAVSFLSTAFVLIPVLAGGCFMALTPVVGSAGGLELRPVRIFANVPAYAILVALLILYVLALVGLLLFPSRQAYKLPHGVSCIAEVVSFLVNEDLRSEEAFKGLRNREEMLDRLGVRSGGREGRGARPQTGSQEKERRSWTEQPRAVWTLDVGLGGPIVSGLSSGGFSGAGSAGLRGSEAGGVGPLGVRRARKYTERRKTRIRKGDVRLDKAVPEEEQRLEQMLPVFVCEGRGGER